MTPLSTCSTEGVLNIAVPGLFGQIDASKFNWNFQTTPQGGLNNRTITYSRGKGLGGSTAVSTWLSLACLTVL